MPDEENIDLLRKGSAITVFFHEKVKMGGDPKTQGRLTVRCGSSLMKQLKPSAIAMRIDIARPCSCAGNTALSARTS